MTTLREAAQQALEALESACHGYVTGGLPEVQQSITALRAALAEPENWELRRLSEELERCKQTCAATSEAWREEAALAKPCPCSDRPAAQCPGEWEPGCDLGNNPKYAKRVDLAEPFALPCPTPKACKAHCCSGHCVLRTNHQNET